MNLNISKLPFKVIYCSSWENQEFHPNNLNAISHDANAAPSSWQGWQSERFVLIATKRIMLTFEGSAHTHRRS
jgi:hypothetical protein